MRKQVEFDVPGSAAYGEEEMRKRISQITKMHYGVEIDLEGVTLGSYYRADGAKITKTLLAILRRQLPRKEVQDRFAPYGKMVSSLYTIGQSFRAEFGDKTQIGEGVYEKSKTCFRSDGEHRLGKKVLVVNPRCKVIVLYGREKKGAPPVGRCLAYFAGNRNVFLTNFYWKNVSSNKLYFITAAKMLLGLKKVLYRNNPKFYLPIYKNGDAVHLYDERSRFPSPFRKMACPVCGKKVPTVCMIAGENGRDINSVGCSAECSMKAASKYLPCTGCGDLFPQKELMATSLVTSSGLELPEPPGGLAGGRPMYCRTCTPLFTRLCRLCNIRFPTGDPDSEAEKDPSICRRCDSSLATCTSCGSRHYYGHGLIACGPAGMLCRSCLSKKGRICDCCNSYSSRTLKKVEIGKTKYSLCEECSEPYPGTSFAEETAAK